MSGKSGKKKGKPTGKRKWFGGGGGSEKKQRYSVDPSKGLKAVLVTCDMHRERQCEQEIISWLQEAAAKLYPVSEDSCASSGAKESKTISSALEDELKELQEEAKGGAKGSSGGEDRFGALQLEGSGGLVFIQIRDDRIEPGQLVHAMLTEVRDTKQLRTRYSIRIHPVQATCFSSMEDVLKAAKTAIERCFPPLAKTQTTYAIDLRKHGKHSGINRGECIREIAPLIPTAFAVDLHEPDIAVQLSVVRRLACLSIMHEYTKLKKYNVRVLAGLEQEGKDKEQDKGKSEKKEKGKKDKQKDAQRDTESMQIDSAAQKSEQPATATASVSTAAATAPTASDAQRIDANASTAKGKR